MKHFEIAAALAAAMSCLDNPKRGRDANKRKERKKERQNKKKARAKR